MNSRSSTPRAGQGLQFQRRLEITFQTEQYFPAVGTSQKLLAVISVTSLITSRQPLAAIEQNGLTRHLLPQFRISTGSCSEANQVLGA